MEMWFRGMITISRFLSIIFIMYLQKISSFATMVSIVAASIFGLSYYTSQTALALVAQSDRVDVPISAPVGSSEATQCPIDGFAIASFNNFEEIRIDTDFVSSLTLRNTSSYTLSGLRVGLGVFSSDSQVIPDYWFVSEGMYQLPGGGSTEVPVTIDASSLPAGEYSIRSFVMQGDEASVLGSVLRGDSDDSVAVVKSTPKENTVNVVVSVNSNTSSGQTVTVPQNENIEVQVSTTNENTTPVINSSMVVVISQGDVPLGAAVREQVQDSIKLVPSGARQTQLIDRFTESGKYSVYAALVTKDTFQPVEYIPVQVGEGEATESWAYLSRVGLKDDVIRADNDIIGCISYLGKDAGIAGVIETLGMEVEVLDGESVVFSSEVRTEDIQKSYITVRPGLNLETSFVSATLLQERFPSVIGDEGVEVAQLTGETEVFLTPVQTISFNLECQNEDCQGGPDNIVPVSVPATDSTGNSFYFYAAIVIAAALLMYLMLRRLHPEEDLSVGKNVNELQ